MIECWVDSARRGGLWVHESTEILGDLHVPDAYLEYPGVAAPEFLSTLSEAGRWVSEAASSSEC
jgi:hypothetical protein